MILGLLNRFNSHASDPVSSHQAGEAIESSGKAAAHRGIVLAAVKANPGLTSGELEALCGLKLYQVRRRLTDLKNDGLVEYGEQRQCKEYGTLCVTWNLVVP
jgi:transcription initiation factor IIE alpha subunit